MDPVALMGKMHLIISMLIENLREQNLYLVMWDSDSQQDDDLFGYIRLVEELSALFFQTVQMACQPMLRRWWIYPRTDVHWNVFARTVWSDENWITHFRMPRALFKMIVDELRPYLSRQDTQLRKAVPVEKQIAMTIFYLAHHLTYAVVGTFFGVGRTTAYKAIIHVCLCMEMVLLRRAVYLGDYRKVMSGFEAIAGFPQVVGAIDGCHIKIRGPAHEGIYDDEDTQAQPGSPAVGMEEEDLTLRLQNVENRLSELVESQASARDVQSLEGRMREVEERLATLPTPEEWNRMKADMLAIKEWHAAQTLTNL